MQSDWLSLIESAEVGAERAESMLRRHGRLMLTLAGVAAVAMAILVAPSVDTAAQSDPARLPSAPATSASARPSHATAARPSPSGQATLAPASAPCASDGTSPAAAGGARETASPSPSAVAVRAPAGPIYVHVAGAVARPGVVRLAPSARAFEAVRAAGGLLGDADLDRVNLSVRLRDEAMVTVPHRAPETPPTVDDSRDPAPEPVGRPDVAEPTPDASAPTPASDGESPPSPRPGKTPLDALWRRPLSLGTATADDLQRVPGIGPGLARAIVSYRTHHGGFRRVDELRRVPRFGARLFARIQRCFVL